MSLYLFQEISSTTEAINVEDEEVVTTTEISVDETTSESLSRILTGIGFEIEFPEEKST